ncbi:MAG: hypothetical protein NZL98_00605 [Anaerolineales bacterium]|nr:hypothetical protein [Anaerolineales bacterium]MDW8228100.1 hypothetical protein [Anaerolineales bacterium]
MPDLLRAWRLIRWIDFLIATLAFLLGVGLARYLGASVRWEALAIGLLVLGALFLSFTWLREYFRLPFLPRPAEETPGQRERFRLLLLQLSYAGLAVGGVGAVVLVFYRLLGLESSLLLLLIVFVQTLASLPPFRLGERGYGELLAILTLVMFPQALGFYLQQHTYHRLLSLTAFPLVFLAFASFLASGFSRFASDQKLGRESLLSRLTWPRAVIFHHVSLLLAVVFFLLAPLGGLSLALLWPLLLVLPFYGLQVYWLQRIISGAPPLWKFFDLLLYANLALTLYLLTLSFWTR